MRLTIRYTYLKLIFIWWDGLNEGYIRKHNIGVSDLERFERFFSLLSSPVPPMRCYLFSIFSLNRQFMWDIWFFLFIFSRGCALLVKVCPKGGFSKMFLKSYSSAIFPHFLGIRFDDRHFNFFEALLEGLSGNFQESFIMWLVLRIMWIEIWDFQFACFSSRCLIIFVLYILVLGSLWWNLKLSLVSVIWIRNFSIRLFFRIPDWVGSE